MKEIIKTFGKLKPYCINEEEEDILINMLEKTNIKSSEIFLMLNSTNDTTTIRLLWNLLDTNQKMYLSTEKWAKNPI